MLSGPELVRLQQQFEDEYTCLIMIQNTQRIFETTNSVLQRGRHFSTRFTALITSFEKMGNPFLDDFPELVTLYSCTWMDDSVEESLCSLEETGTTQYREYVKAVLQDCTDSIHSPMKKIPWLFSSGHSQRSNQIKVGKWKSSKTMWHSLASCTFLCKAEMVIWKNSLPMRYNFFHHLCQTWVSFIYLTQSQIFWKVSSNLWRMNHLQHMIA